MSNIDIRKVFTNYFSDNEHEAVASSSLIPDDDTLLFTNAGMVQFKNVFTGADPRPYDRATTVQKCMRAGGKHNDLENVGFTTRHHTFFEMLGNFSFGAYFKHDAIGYAWEFLTVVLKIPKEKLWVTAHHDDKKSADIWLNDIKVNPSQFVYLGDESNFWSMGEVGPCGPSTEIFYDHGDGVPGGPPGSPDEDGDRFVEIWNLVFMQFDRNLKGELTPLPNPCVDTGMGLERISAVIEGVSDNYETKLFRSLLKDIIRIGADDSAENETSRRVVADHIRSIVFLLSEGLLPGNEGRGYVLRRIIRRAARHGVKLGFKDPFMYRLVVSMVRIMGRWYPELHKQQEKITENLRKEEMQFAQTLTRGLKILDQHIEGLSGDELSGSIVFTLYDTYGFPPDMTADIARERSLKVDYAGFEKAMKKQRDQSRQSHSFSLDYTQQLHIPGETKFLGYSCLSHAAVVSHLLKSDRPVSQLAKNDKGVVVLDVTPFYAESGGQIGDSGVLIGRNGKFQVTDTQKQGKIILHVGHVSSGKFSVNDEITAEVDDARRDIMANHSATHLLHAALHNVLGDHVKQKGSLVNAERLRFDFSHTAPLTHQEIRSIENQVNDQIRNNLDVTVEVMSITDLKKSGIIALFDKKYTDSVRVLRMGEYSAEACGGTHVKSTGDIGLFKIVTEAASSSGVRRIEAVTGSHALQRVHDIESCLQTSAEHLQTGLLDVSDKVSLLQNELVQSNKQIQKLNQRIVSAYRLELAAQAQTIGEVNILVSELEHISGAELRDLCDQLKAKLGSCVIVLAIKQKQKVQLVCSVTKDLFDQLTARDVLSYIAPKVGGRGGGRSDLAQGGGDQPDKLPDALRETTDWLTAKLSEKLTKK